MNQKSKESSTSLHSDLPLSKVEEDIFGWREPAQDLAVILLDSGFNARGSFVASIEGKWGSGKSSFLFLLKDSISKLVEDDSVTILEYNPWLMPKRDHAVYFFDQISKSTALGDSKLASLFKQLGSVSERTSALIESTEALILRISGVIILLGITASWNLESVPKWLSLSLFIMALAVIFVDWIGNLARKVFNKHPKSVQTLKAELVSALANNKSNRRLVICIDDVDRLRGEQISSVLQLIKNNGDLPNTLFLVCLDSEHVAKELSDSGTADSREYLEKFIQLRMHVPEPSSHKFREYLDVEIDSSLPKHCENFDSLWSKSDWEQLVNDSILPLLTDIRCVKRFVNSLRARFENFVIDKYLQINPVDFLCIELIRTVLPQFYLTIASNSNLLVPSVERRVAEMIDEGKTKSKSEYEKLVSILPSRDRTSIEKLLRFLFPRVGLLQDTNRNWDSAEPLFEYEASLRLCHPEVFENYFTAVVPRNRIIESELSNYFSRLKSSPPNREAFVPTSWDDTSQRLNKVLYRYRNGSYKISTNSEIQRLITNLLQFSDDAPSSMEPHPLEYYARFWTATIKVESDRIGTLRNSIRNSDALGGPAALLNLLYIDIDSDMQDPVLKREALDYIKIGLNENILEGLSSNRIRRSTRLRSILNYFKSHSQEKEYNSLLQHLFTKDEYRILLINSYFFNESTFRGGSPTVEKKFGAENLRKLLSSPELWDKFAHVPAAFFEDISDYNIFSEAVRAVEG